MSLLALSDSFEYLCYGSTAIRNIFYSYSAAIDLQSSDTLFNVLRWFINFIVQLVRREFVLSYSIKKISDGAITID